jgi:hypothetical protein
MKYNILPLVSEFLLSLMSSAVKNMEESQINSDIHSIKHKTYIYMIPKCQILNSLVYREMCSVQESRYSVFFHLSLNV